MEKNTPQIVWFKNDLRILDQPALHAAASTGRPIIALYILDESIGHAARWWLHHSLNALRTELKMIGGKLILRRGDAVTIITEMALQTGAKSVFWNRSYEPASRKQEESLCSELWKRNIESHHFNGALLIEPWEISNKQGGYYKVFTQYWKTCLKIIEPSKPLPKTERIVPYQHAMPTDEQADWQLLPSHPDWSQGFYIAWHPGEKGALDTLQNFLEGKLSEYDHQREFPAEPGTSLLSPHLRFGEISPRVIWQALRLQSIQQGDSLAAISSERFLTELGWREFSYYLLYHFPELPQKPFNARFEAFPWREDMGLLKAWQKGRTGYPIVDAGMRQLWQIGWMHNRVRMIVASFLTKDLRITWQAGADWFLDTLVDADLANNSASWQWVAGCGADAAPYFRIFNPVLQGQKFDPHGTFIKRWIPELKDLPQKYIHCPWEAPPLILRSCGLTIGKDYPLPIVDHSQARLDALEAFRA